MVKKYIMNESLSWEERYKELEAHHIEETTELKGKLDGVRSEVLDLKNKMESFRKQLTDHQEKLKIFHEEELKRFNESCRKGYSCD